MTKATLKKKLSNVDPRTAWGYAIQTALTKKDPSAFAQLVEQLKSQAEDNPPAMEKILNFDILKAA